MSMFNLVISLVAGMAGVTSELALGYPPTGVFIGCSVVTFLVLSLLRRWLWPSEKQAEASDGFRRKGRKRFRKKKRRYSLRRQCAEEYAEHTLED